MDRFALISVYYKDGIERLSRSLVNKGFKLISTGGTYEYLRSFGFEVTRVEDVTHFPESPGGRVKTLHPGIFAGILARRDNKEDMEYLEKNHIPLIDFVVVNLYPFTEKRDLATHELLEFVDIGGISLIRAAAKNYRWVTLVCDPHDYDYISKHLENDTIDEKLRSQLAIKGFMKTVQYDAAILSELSARFGTEHNLKVFLFSKHQELRYGENPHQKGSVYFNILEGHSFLQNLEVLSGIELSYNNILDAYSAYNIVSEFNEPACAIVKHNIPCGVALGNDILEAYKKALSGDELSAYGGIVALNRTVGKELAEVLNDFFFEVIVAADYTNEALEVLRKKKKRRVLKVKCFTRIAEDYRFVDHDLLVQDSDLRELSEDDLKVLTGELDGREMNDIFFGDKVVKHVKSNAIVVVKDRMLLGMGGGQTSRVDATKIALEKAGDRARGAIMVSDGFFPFTDSLELAVKSGIKVVVEPGGSVRDEEIIKFARESGLTLVFTGVRRFKH
ncbi:MAG: bifunctional phosphoribosylaminoimidazolecarboxamide formyltransferase/IMP cyclohydrolase [candidate division WOR-3 bacterium]